MLGEFCICSTNKVPGGSLYVSTYKIYEHTCKNGHFLTCICAFV